MDKEYILIEVIEREVNIFEFSNLADARLVQISFFCDFNHEHIDTETEVLLRSGKVDEVIKDGCEGFGDEWEVTDRTCWSNLNSSANYDSYIVELPQRYVVNTSAIRQQNEEYIKNYSI